MKPLQRLARTELVALLALFVVAAGVAGYAALQSTSASSSMLGPIQSAQLAFMGTLLFGGLPVALFGAPAYAWLSHRTKITWPTVVLLGVSPGAATFFLDTELGVICSVCGLSVSVLTHVACNRW